MVCELIENEPKSNVTVFISQIRNNTLTAVHIIERFVRTDLISLVKLLNGIVYPPEYHMLYREDYECWFCVPGQKTRISYIR